MSIQQSKMLVRGGTVEFKSWFGALRRVKPGGRSARAPVNMGGRDGVSTPMAVFVSVLVAAVCSGALLLGSLADEKTVLMNGVAGDSARAAGPARSETPELSVTPETLVISVDGLIRSTTVDSMADSLADSTVDQASAAGASTTATTTTAISATTVEPDSAPESTVAPDYEWEPADSDTPWTVAVLIIKNYDFEVEGQRHTYAMSRQRLQRSRRTAAALKERLADKLATEGELVGVDIIELDDTMRSVTARDGGYWFSEADSAAVVDRYAPDGSYDSVLLVTEIDPAVAGDWSGLAPGPEPSAATEGPSFAVVRVPGLGIWVNLLVGEACAGVDSASSARKGLKRADSSTGRPGTKSPDCRSEPLE